MLIASCYLLLASLFAAASFAVSLLWLKLLLAWTALSLLVVSSAYCFNLASVFRKRSNGSMPWYSRWLFIPFLLGVRLYNHIARARDTVPPVQRIAKGLYLGARLTAADLDLLQRQRISAVLDVTAEFAALDQLSQLPDIKYLNIPVLDHACPSAAQLSQAVRWLQQQRAAGNRVLVHCALGRGRSVLVLAAFLLSRHQSQSTGQAVALIRQVRHTARLNRRQLKALRQFADNFSDTKPKPVWLIANPVSGGGKWAQAEAEIISLLSPFLSLNIQLTSETCSAQQLAQQAVAAGCELVIVCGGDGSVTEVASVLVGRDVRLGIIPLGTTNALCHALWGVSAKLLPLRSACLNILDGESKAIDTARCNDKLMLLLAGVGFEQQMIAAADRERKNALGQLAYLDGLWQAVQSNQQQDLVLTLDDKPAQALTTSSLVVANAAPLTTLLAQGGGAPDLTDGKLDVTWLKTEPSSSALPGLAELALAGLTGLNPEIASQSCQAHRIHIQRQDGTTLHYVIDGEVFSDKALDIRIVPASLHIMLADDDEVAL